MFGLITAIKQMTDANKITVALCTIIILIISIFIYIIIVIIIITLLLLLLLLLLLVCAGRSRDHGSVQRGRDELLGQLGKAHH